MDIRKLANHWKQTSQGEDGVFAVIPLIRESAAKLSQKDIAPFSGALRLFYQQMLNSTQQQVFKTILLQKQNVSSELMDNPELLELQTRRKALEAEWMTMKDHHSELQEQEARFQQLSLEKEQLAREIQHLEQKLVRIVEAIG